MTVAEGFPTTPIAEISKEIAYDFHDLDYEKYDFAEVARCMGILDNPEVAALYDQCLKAEYTTRIAYEQSLLPIVHAFDLAHQDGITDLELQGLGFLIADIHRKKELFYPCMHELAVIKRRFMEMGPEQYPELIEYVTTAIHDIAPFAVPVVSSNILADKNAPTAP